MVGNRIELYIVFLIVVGNRFLTFERAKLAEGSFPVKCFKCGSHDKKSSKWMSTNLKNVEDGGFKPRRGLF